MLAPCVAVGETASWTNNSPSAATALWTVPANWTNELGEVLTEMPTNGQDVVFNSLLELSGSAAYVGDSKQLYEQTIGAGSDNIPFRVRLGSVSGMDRYTLRFDDRVDQNSHPYAAKYPRVISIADPNDFFGYWVSGGGRGTFALHPTAEFTPVMHNVSSKHRPVVEVPEAQARIDWFYDGGAVEKTGSGDLEITTTTGDRAAVYVKGGSLTLGGTAKGALEDVLAKAALHLDASDYSTLSTGPSNGYESVFCWYDVRGKDYGYATNSAYSGSSSTYLPFANPPFLSDSAVSPTGLRLVDFGSRSKPDKVVVDYPGRGPTNCVLMLHTRITGIRAAFYACSHPNGVADSMTLGDGATICFVTGNNSSLFDTTYSDPAVRHGDLLVNLEKRLNAGIGSDGTLTNLYTFAGGFARGVQVDNLGSRQHYVSTTGGTRMGEVILFTNELTQAERTIVARYMDAKWRTGDKGYDLGAIVAANGAATVTVPEGKVASVRTVDAPGGLVKKGGGTLSIGTLQPADCAVTVSGGALALEDADIISDGAPAANPYIWLDADAPDTFTDAPVVGSSTNYVSAWKDVRDGCAVTATAALDPPHMPFVVASDIVNRNVVDFGTFMDWDYSWMKLPNWKANTHASYSAFIVYRNKGNAKDGKNASIPIFGSSTKVSYRDRTDCLVSPNYINPISAAATWAINGNVVDPLFTSGFGANFNEFMVISVRSRVPLCFDALAKDRSGDSEAAYAGGVQIGEYIIYDHPLTYDEHRNTEAYLMRKWLGLPHPDSDRRLSNVKAATDIPIEMDVGSDITVDALSGGTGEFVKTGDGTLKVNSIAGASVASSITVEGGTLSLNVTNSPLPIFTEARFRFDASDDSSFASYEVIDGVTNVLSWKSLVGGITADAVISSVAKTNPVLKYVETRPGVVRPVMDFGEYCSSTNDVITDGVGATMQFSTRQTGVKEIHQIFADANGSNRQWVIGDTQGYDFARGKNGLLYENDDPVPYRASSVVRNSQSWLDGETAYYSTKVGSGFLNFGFRCWHATAAYASWTASVGAFAGGMRVMAGGQQIAESVAFNRLLTDDERAAVNDYLNWKWLDGEKPDPAVTNSIAAVSLANNSSLVLNAPDALALFDIAAMSGNGTVSVKKGEIVGVSALAFNVAADGTADCLAVDGAVTFAPPISVTVSFEEGFMPVYGEQTLFSATSAANLSAGNVSVNCPKLRQCAVMVKVTDNAIRLRVAPKGMVFSFR